ncbi:MAG: hypothetical protein ACRDV3_06860 [Acidothermaceae bacterium]
MSTPATPFRPPSSASSSVVDAELAGRFVAWSAATVAGRVQVGPAASAIEAGTNAHVVVGSPAASAETSQEISLREALDAMLAAQPRRLTLVLPTTGDPLGLSGIGPFTQAAVLAEVGVAVEYADASFGWVPEPDARGSSYSGVRWKVLPGSAAATVLTVDADRIVEQADRALRRALRSATETLGNVDLARWRPEVASGRVAADAALQAKVRAMPPGWPVAARVLGERAIALWRVLRVATADQGAVSASGSAARIEALRALSHAVREATMTAFNVPAAALLRDSGVR